MNDVRAQVQEQIIDVIREAEDQGLDGFRAAQRAFPGTPEIVIIMASVELDGRRTEAWWQQVERTIDGEIIRNALSKAGATPDDKAGGCS